MLNWLKQYGFALILTAFGIAILDVTASSFMTCHPITVDTAQQAQSPQQQECTALAGPLLVSLLAIVDFLDDHSETVTAIFTIVLAVFTGRLWYSTEGLFRVTKLVADADRPHMIPSEFKIIGIRGNPDEDGNVEITVRYKFINYGRSPAFIKQYSIRYVYFESKFAIPVGYGDPVKTNYIIAVNGWWGSVEPSKVKIPKADIDKILSGELAYITVGYIEYGDAAGQDHKIRFAYSYKFGDSDSSERFLPYGSDDFREYT